MEVSVAELRFEVQRRLSLYPGENSESEVVVTCNSLWAGAEAVTQGLRTQAHGPELDKAQGVTIADGYRRLHRWCYDVLVLFCRSR